MGQGLAKGLEGCVESALTGSTSRETALEQQCAELARQNEQLRLKLINAAQGGPGASCVRSPSSVKMMTPQITTSASLPSDAGLPAVRDRVASLTRMATVQSIGATPGSHHGMGARDREADTSKTDLAALAVAAAAQEAADYQSSLVRVQIDNESLDNKTEVIVQAPARERLLADMSGALSGLGLLVLEAQIKTEGAQAINTFVVQDSTHNQVLEPARLAAIEQRLQQRFCGEQGINGGVRRLVVDRFIKVVPPWEHEALPAQSPTQLEETVWLATMSAALRGGSSLGQVAPALADRLAADLLPEMTRMKLPRGGTVASDATGGEWLLLLETGRARVTTDATASLSPGERRGSFGGSFGGNLFGTASGGKSSPHLEHSSQVFNRSPQANRRASAVGELRGADPFLGQEHLRRLSTLRADPSFEHARRRRSRWQPRGGAGWLGGTPAGLSERASWRASERERESPRPTPHATPRPRLTAHAGGNAPRSETEAARW